MYHVFQANIGQDEDFDVAREKAIKIGATKASLLLCNQILLGIGKSYTQSYQVKTSAKYWLNCN